MARPRKKEGELYSERVPVRLRPRDKEQLERIADERGIPSSIVAREVIMDYIAHHGTGTLRASDDPTTASPPG